MAAHALYSADKRRHGSSPPSPGTEGRSVDTRLRHAGKTRGYDTRHAGATSDTRARHAAARDRCRAHVARERARKIASKNRSSTTTGIGGSFQLANSAPPLGVTGSASAPTARMGQLEAGPSRLRASQRAQAAGVPREGWSSPVHASQRAQAAKSEPASQMYLAKAGVARKGAKGNIVASQVSFSAAYLRWDGLGKPRCYAGFSRRSCSIGIASIASPSAFSQHERRLPNAG